MQISEINNKDELSALIINELKDIGVKYRKDKKSKVIQEKSCRKRIFHTHLHLLELTDVILANGNVVQIPRFVADACNRILEQVETEGIFRKAGSSIRQKEIRNSLEAGLSLGKAHHVIDVANVVKSFFRELPEPLIPSSMQETLLRSLLIGANHIKAILLTCLLLPPLTINTLSFFMQFLHTVSLSEHQNKMSVENLAIIFTPGLMPFSDISSHRFNNHVKMVQLLIEQAHVIGTIPNCIIDKLHIHEVISNTPSKSRSFEALEVVVTQKKKKKRRSEMFNGLRKIVGSAIGSSENLENTPEQKTTGPGAASNESMQRQQQQAAAVATPSLLKSTKKRKFAEPVCAFSAKKKKDLLALLPNNSGGFLPNTPLTKEPKKSRLSLGGRRHMKNISNNPVVTSMERRWSIVGSGWTKNRNKHNSNEVAKKDYDNIIDHNMMMLPTTATAADADIDEEITTNEQHVLGPCITKHEHQPKIVGYHPIVENISFADSVSVTDGSEVSSSAAADYVRISKNEYEAIKERVAAIETRISQEFGSMCSSSSFSARRSYSSLDTDLDVELNSGSGPERVLHKYAQIVEHTEALTSPSTEQLAQRLSRGLKIRRSSEQRIMRSPSARKIGTMRRRSQEKVRLSRNQTWHISATAAKMTTTMHPLPPQNCFYAKSSLKRGRPNTLASGLQTPCTPVSESARRCDFERTYEQSVGEENWTDGAAFFGDAQTPQLAPPPLPPYAQMENKSIVELSVLQQRYFDEQPCSTPVRKCNENGDEQMKTPMLPPKSLPRKLHNTQRTPNTSSLRPLSASKMANTHSLLASTPNMDEELNGRASIARLRALNAGMVMAKAKLFDGLGGAAAAVENPTTQRPQNNRRESKRFVMASNSNIKSHKTAVQPAATNCYSSPPCLLDSPNVSRNRKQLVCKSPGYVQKRHKLTLATKYPNRQILDSIATDVQLTQPRRQQDNNNVNIGSNNTPRIRNTKTRGGTTTGNTASPSTPRNRHKHFNVNSPRRARNQAVVNNSTRVRTPLKTCKPVSAMQRNSPRVAKAQASLAAGGGGRKHIT